MSSFARLALTSRSVAFWNWQRLTKVSPTTSEELLLYRKRRNRVAQAWPGAEVVEDEVADVGRGRFLLVD